MSHREISPELGATYQLLLRSKGILKGGKVIFMYVNPEACNGRFFHA